MPEFHRCRPLVHEARRGGGIRLLQEAGDAIGAVDAGQRIAALDIAIAGLGRGRPHAEGDDPPGPGRGRGNGQRPVQRRRVGDRVVRRQHPQHRVRVLFRHQQRRRRDRRGGVAAHRLQHDARVTCTRRRATARPPGTGAPGCTPRPAGRSPARAHAAPSPASCVRADTSGHSCLGNVSRDTGHSRVPEPPDRMTGTIRPSGAGVRQKLAAGRTCGPRC